MSGRLDIILFGASGLSGKYCVRALDHLTRLRGSKEQFLTWGVAGRSPTKLKATLDYWGKRLGNEANFNNVPVIKSDVNDYASLTTMTARARVIVNCCGPFRLHGEPVIRACLETGTHQIDICGEPQYMEEMELKYHETAEEKGVYVVNACGFESIMCDLGILLLERHFEGTLNSVEVCLQMKNDPANDSNNMFNIATWESAIHGVSNASRIREIRSKLHRKKLPQWLPKLQNRPLDTKNGLVDGCYVIPNPSCDKSVILRTRRYLYEKKNMRAVQLKTYFGVDTSRGLRLLAVYKKLFEFLVRSEFGRKLLLKFPDMFSNGYFTRAENLPGEKLEKIQYVLSMLGTGWDTKALRVEGDVHNYKDLPNKTIRAAIEGYDPAYSVTSNLVVTSAIVLLTEKEKLPSRGGVYTPGAAFIDTSMMEQLQMNNVLNFNIKSKL